MIPDVRGGHILSAKLAGSETSTPGKHERRLPHTGRRMVARYMATRLFLQERQKSHVPRDEHTQPLLVVVPRQNTAIHVKVRRVAELKQTGMKEEQNMWCHPRNFLMFLMCYYVYYIRAVYLYVG